MKSWFRQKQLHLCLLALLLIIPAPIAAENYITAPIIEQGGTIFFGEQGLNVTHALNQAYYRGTTGTPGTRAQNNSVPPLTAIGWWASGADLYVTSPSRTLDLLNSYTSFTVVPLNYAGYTGDWYLLNGAGTRPIGDTAEASRVFTVLDPALDLRIRDIGADTDVSGKTVPQGTSIGFRIETTMYPAIDGRYRSPVFNSNRSGYIDIRVRNESGSVFTALRDSHGRSYSLLRQNVSAIPWTWGDPLNPASPHAWATGIRSSGQMAYPPGRYYAWAESGLNNMRENYKMGGTDYTGKTVSNVRSVTLETTDPSITVYAPNGGQNWRQGSVNTIIWNYTGNPGTLVRIDLLKGAALNRVITAGTATGSAGSGSYAWTVPFNQRLGTDFRIRVTSTTSALYNDTSDANFAIRAGAPLTVTVPNGGQTWNRGLIYRINWTYSGSPGSFVKIDLLKGAVVRRTLFANTTIGSGGSGSKSWLVPASQVAGSDYRIKITSLQNFLWNDTGNAYFTIRA